MSSSRLVPVQNWRGGQPPGPAVDDCIAAEVPVALTYNRVSHVVMMATPLDLEDFALGFSLTEGLIGQVADLLAIRVIPRAGGLELAMTIGGEWFDRLATRRRNMAGRTGCGLCGAENIEQALRLPGPVKRTLGLPHAALQRAVDALERHQPLQADTGATHGAAWCHREGRELLVAVSAPTTLAVEFAQRCGQTLVGFARPGRHNVYSYPERIAESLTAEEKK